LCFKSDKGFRDVTDIWNIAAIFIANRYQLLVIRGMRGPIVSLNNAEPTHQKRKLILKRENRL